MNLDEEPLEERPARHSDARFIWRMLGASVFFLLIGLLFMWIWYAFQDKPGVRLDAAYEPPAPALPSQSTAPNWIRLYYTADGVTLTPEMREIVPPDSTQERATAVLKALLEGPRGAGNLRSPIPPNATLNAIYVQDREAILDFSKHLRDELSPSVTAETLCVYGLVNTLLRNCPELKTVTLLIDGQPLTTLRGAVDLSTPLVENLALVSVEKGRS